MLRNRRLVGHVDEATGQVVPNRPTRARAAGPASTRLFVGATRLLDHAAAELGLRPDLEAALPGMGDAMLSLAYWLVCEDSSPLSRFHRWAATRAHPFGEPISSQRASGLLAAASGEDAKERLLAAQAARRAEGQWWFYDTTSVSTWSGCLTQAKWGHNKDHQPLPQLNLAVLFGQTTGLPFHDRKLAGNIPDVSTVEHLIAGLPALGGARPKIACDRGFWSKKNIDDLLTAHLKFLIGARMGARIVRDTLAANDEALRCWENWDADRDVFALRVPITWDWEQAHPRTGGTEKAGKRAYLHLFHSPALAADQEAGFAKLLKQLHRELAAGNRVEAHRGLYNKYFTVKRGQAVGRDQAIAAQRARHGHFALLTNDAKTTPAAALDAYRRKDTIEKAFSDVKTRLDFRTPKVSTDQTLEGKLLLVYVALTLTSWLKKKMTDARLWKDWTLHEVIDELDAIEEYHQPGHRPRTLETTQKQRDLYVAFGVPLP
jgi:hypothetical protein